MSNLHLLYVMLIVEKQWHHLEASTWHTSFQGPLFISLIDSTVGCLQLQEIRQLHEQATETFLINNVN